MTIAAGTKLGHYEILAPIGAGGMGEVYRARDSKLDRDVAVKVLSDRVAADSEALARFEREAKAVAAVSHPNILAIHDFGTDQDIFRNDDRCRAGDAEQLSSTGPRGVGVFFAKASLAITLCEQGRYTEAEAAQRAVVRGSERLLGQDHPFIPRLSSFLARILAEKGELAEAEVMLREVLQTQQRELGHHHLSTLWTVLELVDVLNAKEEFEEARRLARDIIPSLRDQFGEEDILRLRALNGLALALHGLGRLEEAEVISQEVVGTSQRVFTTGLWCLPAFQAHFGRCLTDLNRFEEAEPQLLAAYEGEMAMRGEAHKNTRRVIEHLAHLYEKWDKPEQGAKWRAKLPTANPAPGPNGEKQ